MIQELLKAVIEDHCYYARNWSPFFAGSNWFGLRTLTIKVAEVPYEAFKHKKVLPFQRMSRIWKDFFWSAVPMQQNSLMTNLEFGKQWMRDRLDYPNNNIPKPVHYILIIRMGSKHRKDVYFIQDGLFVIIQRINKTISAEFSQKDKFILPEKL